MDENLAALAKVADGHKRIFQTSAYLKSLPPWPEPLPWLEEGAKIKSATSEEIAPPKGLKRLSLKDARYILEKDYPKVRDRCQAVVAELDQALAMQSVLTPNDPIALPDHLGSRNH